MRSLLSKGTMIFEYLIDNPKKFLEINNFRVASDGMSNLGYIMEVNGQLDLTKIYQAHSPTVLELEQLGKSISDYDWFSICASRALSKE